ncbi:hypothetical protein PCE1_004538 [Barthelona sp. PCE]
MGKNTSFSKKRTAENTISQTDSGSLPHKKLQKTEDLNDTTFFESFTNDGYEFFDVDEQELNDFLVQEVDVNSEEYMRLVGSAPSESVHVEQDEAETASFSVSTVYPANTTPSPSAVSAWECCELHNSLIYSLEENGFPSPLTIQTEVVPYLTLGRNVIISSPTGSGKTLSFVLPVLNRILGASLSEKSPYTLIVAPTRELAKQIGQVVNLFKNAVKRLHTLVLVGGMSIQKQERVLRKLPHVVIGTPGRIMDCMSRGILDISETKFLICDEIDKTLKQNDTDPIFTGFNINGQIALCSATALFNDGQMSVFCERFGRKPKDFKVFDIQDAEIVSADVTLLQVRLQDGSFYCRARYLYALLQELETNSKIIVFVNVIDTANKLARVLSILGMTTHVLHAKQKQKQRFQVIENFEKKNGILVTTDVACRGIDLPFVENVIHFHVPRSSEILVHRSGRTGRAGKKGCAHLLFSNNDRGAWAAIKDDLETTVMNRTLSTSLLLSTQEIVAEAIEVEATEHRTMKAATKDGRTQRMMKALDYADEDIAELNVDLQKTRKERKKINVKKKKVMEQALAHKGKKTKGFIVGRPEVMKKNTKNTLVVKKRRFGSGL